jgi:ribose transport system permease protein
VTTLTPLTPTPTETVRRARRGPRRRHQLLLGALTAVVLLLLAARVLLGDYTVTIPDFVRILRGAEIPGATFIVLELKLPQAVLGLLAGLAFGLAGAIFQSTLRNPLASPDIIGVSLGASATATIAIVIFGADPIAATLGMLTVLRGVVKVMLEPYSSIPAFIPDFYEFTNTSIGLVPILFAFAFVGAAMATVLVMLNRLGRHIRAAGGDAVAAARAGINVPLIRFAALIVCAVGAGIGGIIYIGQLGGGSVALGDGMEFEVYAALLIGGYSIMRGGVGNPAGAVMGVLVVAGLNNILDIQRMSNYYTHIIIGILIIGAVFLDRLRGGDTYE